MMTLEQRFDAIRAASEELRSSEQTRYVELKDDTGRVYWAACGNAGGVWITEVGPMGAAKVFED